MLDTLNNLDHQLFSFLNGMNSPAWDKIMLFITSKYTWIPVYIGLIVFLIGKYRKWGILCVMALLVTVGLSDASSSQLAKPGFKRPRPSHDASLTSTIHVIGSRGKEYGFYSSHASNTFAVAAFLVFVFRRKTKWIYWTFAWSALVSYSRIYCGVHFPLDITAGAFAGVLWAFGGYLSLTYVSKKFKLKEPSIGS